MVTFKTIDAEQLLNSDVRGCILLHLESVIQCYSVLVLLELFDKLPQKKKSLVLPLPHLKIKKKKLML